MTTGVANSDALRGGPTRSSTTEQPWMESAESLMTGSARTIESKILTPKELVSTARLVAERGRNVVWTNGCFDLLHQGHVRYLEAARSLGDLLMVGINDDASVRRLKGNDRPVIPLGGRLEVLAALESVDALTWFGEETPLRLIKAVRPAVIAKGGDYRPEEVVGGREARAWGGRVAVLDHVEGRSTTELLRRIREREREA